MTPIVKQRDDAIDLLKEGHELIKAIYADQPAKIARFSKNADNAVALLEHAFPISDEARAVGIE